MAIQISSFNVIEVARAAVGESKPAAVTAELTYDLSAFRRGDVKDEWDELKEHDVVFLLSIRPPNDCERAGMSETGIAATAGLRCNFSLCPFCCFLSRLCFGCVEGA
jgi:intron-binding protein aquarius